MIRNYLFSNVSEDINMQIETKIREQIRIYMPAVKVSSVLFDSSQIESYRLGIMLVYSIPKLGLKDLIEITI